MPGISQAFSLVLRSRRFFRRGTRGLGPGGYGQCNDRFIQQSELVPAPAETELPAVGEYRSGTAAGEGQGALRSALCAPGSRP